MLQGVCFCNWVCIQHIVVLVWRKRVLGTLQQALLHRVLAAVQQQCCCLACAWGLQVESNCITGCGLPSSLKMAAMSRP
jgi:hypothetical protein